MIRSDRVRELMKERDFTQSELARRVNVTQGAIAKIAKNNPNRSSVLHLVARELRTTPAYLTGETDDPLADAPPAPLLDMEERELIERFQAMAKADRRAVLQIVRSIGGSASSPTIHDRRSEFRGEE